MEQYFTQQHLHYLGLALERLKEWVPFSKEELLGYYEETENSGYEEIDGYHYCLFTWPELNDEGKITEHLEDAVISERVVLLVFDAEDRIIADIAAIHCSTNVFLENPSLFQLLCEESDWAYLEHYTLCGVYFPDLPYPLCEAHVEPLTENHGETILYTNAYVTRTYRRNGIFRNMVDMVREYAVKEHMEGQIPLYQVFAMDPDVACYGPDTVSEPYVYNFEKDEPDRLRNAEILQRLGFTPLRLEETVDDPDADGTKLWFACKKELVVLVDEEYII